MHLITGLLLTYFAGRKTKKPIPPLLRVGGPIKTIHLLPGRVRFKIATLAGNRGDSDKIVNTLSSLKGVTTIEVNNYSGSVLIVFNENEIQAELLFTALIRILGLEKQLEHTNESRIAREIQTIGKSINRAFNENTGGFIDLWTAIALTMAFIGSKKLIKEKSAAFPAGFTLVWWAVNMLLRGK